MAGIDEIKRLKRLCEEYGLEGREILSRHTDEELAGIFNGIGPDAFPQWRGLLRLSLRESSSLRSSADLIAVGDRRISRRIFDMRICRNRRTK